jgi:hypothetical protein
MHQRSNLAELDKLKARIQALRAKTINNGCTEDEALFAASKVAELLDRYDLSLTDVEMLEASCERLEYETWRKKRIPIDGCVGAVAHFCDCRVWPGKVTIHRNRDQLVTHQCVCLSVFTRPRPKPVISPGKAQPVPSKYGTWMVIRVVVPTLVVM